MGQERLAVRVRRVASGTGEQTEALTVFCPRLQHSVDIDACTACGFCHRITVDPADRNSFIMCDGAPAKNPWSPPRESALGQLNAFIRDVMTTVVLCLRPDVNIEAIVSTFLERGISGAPVVDGQGRPLGVVSKTDLVRELELRGARAEAARTAADIMIPIAFTLPELAPVSMAAALMAYEGVHRIPVLADDGRVVGILSALDILRLLGTSDAR